MASTRWTSWKLEHVWQYIGSLSGRHKSNNSLTVNACNIVIRSVQEMVSDTHLVSSMFGICYISVSCEIGLDIVPLKDSCTFSCHNKFLN